MPTRKKKTIKAWMTIPPDIENWNIGSLIYGTEYDAKSSKREDEYIFEVEISYQPMRSKQK